MLKLNVPTKSSFCAADSPQCAVVTLVNYHRAGHAFGKMVKLTNSRAGDSVQELFTPGDWSQFVNDAHIKVLNRTTGLYHVGSVTFTVAEWGAFLAGAEVGEFDV